MCLCEVANDKLLYLVCVDMEKAFCMVRVVQDTCRDAVSKMKVGNEYSEKFRVHVGVYQESVLSPLFIHHSPPGNERN